MWLMRNLELGVRNEANEEFGIRSEECVVRNYELGIMEEGR